MSVIYLVFVPTKADPDEEAEEEMDLDGIDGCEIDSP